MKKQNSLKKNIMPVYTVAFFFVLCCSFLVVFCCRWRLQSTATEKEKLPLGNDRGGGCKAKTVRCTHLLALHESWNAVYAPKSGNRGGGGYKIRARAVIRCMRLCAAALYALSAG